MFINSLAGDNSITIGRLRQLCLQYDKENDSYPENEYEGLSFYNYICEKFNLEQNTDKDWEKDIKNA